MSSRLPNKIRGLLAVQNAEILRLIHDSAIVSLGEKAGIEWFHTIAKLFSNLEDKVCDLCIKCEEEKND